MVALLVSAHNVLNGCFDVFRGNAGSHNGQGQRLSKMADISELRALIVVVVFLGCMSMLITLIPPGFQGATSNIRDYNIPEYFDVNEEMAWNFSDAKTFNISLGYWTPFDWIDVVGGWKILFHAGYRVDGTIQMWMQHLDYWWIFSWVNDGFHWTSSASGIEYSTSSLSKIIMMFESDLDAVFAADGKLRFSMECNHVKLNFWMEFNTTTYSKPSDALHDNAIKCLIGIGLDQINTSFNVFSIISMLLWFEFPDVHWTINWGIRIGLWCAIAYVSAMFIMYLIQTLKPLG